MADYPLIFFPQPDSATRSKLSSGPSHIHLPPYERQNNRLDLLFNQLQTTFNERRIEIQNTTAGIDPDQVLVIETIGSIEDFANAVKHINGFEWMGELEIEEISPDNDFFDESNPNKKISGKLYFIMTNQRALEEMLSLWQRYRTDPDKRFPHNFGRFRKMFECLKNIRRWDIQDRFQETGIIDFWQERLEEIGKEEIRFEIELWFWSSSEKRESSENQVRSIILQTGGRIVGQSIINDIAYHGLLVELPAREIQSIISNPNTRLIKCDEIMFFRPVGQIIYEEHPFVETEKNNESINLDFVDKPNPKNKPIIGLLDGLPLANHRSLQNRIIIDDPDNWEENYIFSARNHGTAMASLIIYGDLNDMNAPLSNPIYVRPIMKPIPNDICTPPREFVPDDILAVDLLHRAIRRIFEGDQGDNPVAPQIKIINLSIGDPIRQFTNEMSPLAKLVDWLGEKYNVLFIVSAGNHPDNIILDIGQENYNSLLPQEREEMIIRAIYRDARNKKLLSPAECLNGLTIGASHHDQCNDIRIGDRFNPFEEELPSPISAFGSGYRRAVKPDIVINGGRQFYRLSRIPSERVIIEPTGSRLPPGNKVASPGRSDGIIDETLFCCGTSNAAALISHTAGLCHDYLLRIINEQIPNIDTDIFIVPLIKSMLVHSCSWLDIGSKISDVLRTPDNGHQIKNLISRWLGYGVAQVNRINGCNPRRITLLGFGQLNDGNAHIFHLPLPPSLSSKRIRRRLTVTLGWLSPIATKNQKYRIASLWFDLYNNGLIPSRRDVDWQSVRRGTVQHEVFEGVDAFPIVEGETIDIRVNCRNDAGKIQHPIPYGIVVSLEVSEGLEIDIYEEVRVSIREIVRIIPNQN